MDPDPEEAVPDALIRRVLHAAWDVPPPDAWSRFVARLDTGQAGVDAPRRRKARRPRRPCAGHLLPQRRVHDALDPPAR